MNDSSELPENLTFFLDRSLGRKTVAGILRAEGLDIRVHDDLLPADASDEAWLKLVGTEGWVAITRDKRIRYNSSELHALKHWKVKAFVIAGRGDLKATDFAQLILAALNPMIRFVGKNHAPFIVKILKDGRIEPVNL